MNTRFFIREIILVLAIILCLESHVLAQGGQVTLQGNIITGSNTGTGNTPVLVLQNHPTLTFTSGTNIFYNTPNVTGTAAIVITGGTTSTTLSGTGTISGAAVGNPVYIINPLPITLPSGATIKGTVSASGTAILTVTVSGTSIVPSGTYQITTLTAY